MTGEKTFSGKSAFWKINIIYIFNDWTQNVRWSSEDLMKLIVAQAKLIELENLGLPKEQLIYLFYMICFVT